MLNAYNDEMLLTQTALVDRLGSYSSDIRDIEAHIVGVLGLPQRAFNTAYFALLSAGRWVENGTSLRPV